MMKFFATVLALIIALAGEYYSEHRANEASAIRSHEFDRLRNGRPVKPSKVVQDSDGTITATYELAVGPRQATGTMEHDYPPCIDPGPSDSTLGATEIGAAIVSALALAGGRIGEAVHPYIAVGAKVAVPDIARLFTNTMVGSCAALNLVPPPAHVPIGAVGFRALVDSPNAPAQECDLHGGGQRNCLRMQTVWLFPLGFPANIGDPSVERFSNIFGLRHPTVVNWANEPRVGILELKFKPLSAP